jgi:pyruvate kinase
VYLTEEGRLLRTKIVATLGGLSHDMFSPSGTEKVPFRGSREDWSRFLEWFREGPGMMLDVLRLNMSFFDPLEDGVHDPECKECIVFEWLRDNARSIGNVAVLGDLPGPKLRMGGLAGPLALEAGDRVELRLAGDLGAPTICAYGRPVAEEDADVAGELSRYLEAEGRSVVSIGDGMATLRLTEVRPDSIVCEALDDGSLADRKGVTFKGLSLALRTFREEDERAVDFLLEHGIDWSEHPWNSESAGSFLGFLAVSFVRCAEDVERARDYIDRAVAKRLAPRFGHLRDAEFAREVRNFAPSVIAKIETREATEDIERIMDVADGAMVARGDLALQIGPQNVPSFQKRLIRLCNVRGKPVITATQMLSSMVSEPEPTRAEASDVFNAILDGTDAVMLSDETASGVFPYQSVRTMGEIAAAAERHIAASGRSEAAGHLDRRRLAERWARDLMLDSELEADAARARLERSLSRAAGRAGTEWLQEIYGDKLRHCEEQRITDEISSASASFVAGGSAYGAIVVPTTSGRTARMIARFRPDVAVLACAHDVLNYRKLALTSGVYAVNCGRFKKGGDELLDSSNSVFELCRNILVSGGLLQEGALIVWTSGAPFTAGTTRLIQIRNV